MSTSIPVEWLKEKQREWPLPCDEPEWNRFVAQARPGDELWAYDNGWNSLAARAGYALVREGRVVADYVTLQS
jgi:hypothetical protein